MSVKIINNAQQKQLIAKPAVNPPVDSILDYYKADKKLYRLDSDGNEEEVNNGGGSKVTITLNNGEAGAMVAGDVVVIDPAVDSSCIFSTTNKDTTVVGTISTGGASGTPVQVCTSGVLNTKVKGAVSRGDSLSTSTTSRRANTAGGAVNAVLGKALEESGGGDSVIKVLINLA